MLLNNGSANNGVAIMWEPQQARTQQLHRNRGMVFSVWSVSRCNKKDKLVRRESKDSFFKEESPFQNMYMSRRE
jgi:hypothetical protein